MWILTPQLPGGETHYLHPGKQYVVGRKNCDILLASDQSISRSHAQLSVTDQTLTLRDTSKYGTFVNGQQPTPPAELSSGDNVTFGVFDSKFSVALLETPVVCSSCLDAAGKASLSQALTALGGKLVNNWTQDCTHLVMPAVKVTIKTISALLCCRPIVKPEYFSELSSAVQQKSSPPKPESHIPEIDEPSLIQEDVDLGMKPVRKQLFTGKTFVFLTSKQMKRLSAAVSFGGGRSRLLEENALPCDLLESPQSCVVEVTAGNSQNLLPPSATEWANSVGNIVRRKGFRLITESEIGLAAIYASCDKYCNPSCRIIDSDPVQKVKARIPSASLSQNVIVDETVLPAASQNITAYAINTETSQRMNVCKATSIAAVGETPEKKQNRNGAKPPGSKLTTSELIVEDTMSSSLSAAAKTNSQRRKPDPKVKVPALGDANFRPPPSAPRNNCGSRSHLHIQSPPKQRTSAQTSPQNQSTLTTFFQPFNKKRPLDKESLAVTSAPKRSALESSIASQDTNSPRLSKRIPSLPLEGPQAVSETSLESVGDSFAGQAEVLPEKPLSRKRKEMELEELESIMSEDMDGLDDEPPSSRVEKEKPTEQIMTKQRQGSPSVESSAKKQCVHQEQIERASQRPDLSQNKEHSQQNLREPPERHLVSVKTEPLPPADKTSPTHNYNKPPQTSDSRPANDEKTLEEDDASFIEDVDLLQVDILQPAEETKADLKPVQIKEEVHESKIDENLPKHLLTVEFRSLMIAAPTKPKPKQAQENGHVKNFKCFRKKQLPGSSGFPHIIGGSDLLVHNTARNSDLDEWLKDAAEEERQNRRDEAMGDNLFRYNPTKLTKRR